MDTIEFKPGDEVLVNDPEIRGVYVFDGYYVSWDNTVVKTHCVVYPPDRPSRARVVLTRLLKPYIETLNPALNLYLIKPTKRNWSWSGYEEAVVAAKDRRTAVQISPMGGLVMQWPVEGWADDVRYIEVERIGSPIEGVKENQVISASYKGE